MRDYLKSGTFALPDGETLVIRELSAGGRRALIDSTKAHKGDPFMVAAVTAQYGVPELRELTPEAVLDLFPPDLLNDMAGAVLRLSGLLAESEAQAEKN